MELRQLRYFVAVADHLSFSRAAQALHLRQQSLSQQISVLERGLGVRLFDRDTRGTRLSDAGHLFLPEARAVLARAAAAEDVARAAARGGAGTLNLAFLSSTANYMLPDRAEISLADLADDDWILSPRDSWPPWHDKYDRDFAAAGFAPRVAQRARGVPNLLGLVAAGVGVTRLASSASSIRRTGVVFVPLTGERAETVFAWPAGRDGPVHRRLSALADDLAGSPDLTHQG